MRRLAGFGALVLLALATAFAAGCGADFPLPTETPVVAAVPSDGSYSMLATWPNMNGIQDVVVTQGAGSQLFLVFNHGGTGGPSIPRGEVALYSFTRPAAIGPPFFNPPRGLFNPIALATTRDRMFVLDQGDTCLARFDPAYNTCAAEGGSGAHGNPIQDLSAYWRVREYSITGGDTLTTFTDTTFAQVQGIAADDLGRVYVSGVAAVLDTSPVNPNIRTRRFVSRVFRYLRGPRYPGVVPADPFMPGANWHRDSTWAIFDGTGASSVSDPRGIVWTGVGPPSIFVADRSNNQVKLVSAQQIETGFLRIDGSETGSNFDSPEGVAVDLSGYLYVVDRLNRRVLRFDPAGNYIQAVNVEPNADGLPLLDPVAVGVDDSVAYVADRGRNEIIRFKRRP